MFDDLNCGLCWNDILWPLNKMCVKSDLMERWYAFKTQGRQFNSGWKKKLCFTYANVIKAKPLLRNKRNKGLASGFS